MKKANINAQDEKGDTPCHILVENGHSEQLVWLLSHYKPDLSIKNNKGEVVSDRKYCAEPQSMTGKIQRYDTHVDMIKKLILEGERANKLASGRSSITAKPVSPAVHPELEAGSSKIRRIKIIEASKKVADHAATKEDAGKEEEKKELSNNNIPVGPQDFLPIQTLGRGAFGEVYLVKFAKTGKLYAMKTQNKRRIIRQNIVKYAQTERNVLSYCKHPFIVGLDFAFQTSERLFLVMDYCPGGDLGHLLTKEKRLTEDRARVYAAEVFLALEYLHSKDIIFRDLKPDNVVMDEDGHVLLTDFGLSKEAMPDHAASQSFLGSVAYLAPEIVKGVGHGKPVDWYLLGVLIYELLVGKPPYFSENREVMYRNILEGQLKLPMYLTSECKDILAKLLNRNIKKRLGCGKEGSLEIRKHAWFKEIDWDVALKRGLKTVKPEIKPIKVVPFSPDIFSDDDPTENNFVEGWDLKKKSEI